MTLEERINRLERYASNLPKPVDYGLIYDTMKEMQRLTTGPINEIEFIQKNGTRAEYIKRRQERSPYNPFAK